MDGYDLDTLLATPSNNIAYAPEKICSCPRAKCKEGLQGEIELLFFMANPSEEHEAPVPTRTIWNSIVSVSWSGVSQMFEGTQHGIPLGN